MSTRPHLPGRRTDRPRRFGLGWPWMICLALLAVPRALFHDLAPLDAVPNAILSIGPVVIWIVAVLATRVPRPFLAVFLIGCIYGVLLGVVHEATWTTVWAQNPPRLGGNLEGVLPAVAETALGRVFTFFSSIVTGAIIGAIGGAIATAINHLRRRRQHQRT